MLPLNDSKSRVLLRLPFAKLAVTALILPLGAFFFCVIWSLTFDFVRSTFTHCDVSNYLPSVSAAIGNYEPQKTVWRLAIFLHLPLRLSVAKMYLGYYRDHIKRNRRMFGILACTLNIIENFALFCLSLWTSADNYEIHRNSFVVFIACSECYMLISYLLNRNARKMNLMPREEKSLRFKRNLFFINVIAFGLAGYCFVRHNNRCETGVYTFFALFEYIVVLTNMGFHMTAYWDFYGLNVVLDAKDGIYLSHL
ncbi:post-GPI attachment to proteins factor 2 [Scaptodrosophila lebanonensis]|uniref:Post-GPI attachment to proteins factor 2 n=1 Tax=Drosophila lebanonensis TaxID=7225 RepID=A0A6J2U548_DROLE|nr:post-GPI attachment to proteins factor 2 [Scaptodrosophila lebanonensis]